MAPQLAKLWRLFACNPLRFVSASSEDRHSPIQAKKKTEIADRVEKNQLIVQEDLDRSKRNNDESTSIY
jgi:hypothetical protein